jgi:predicted phosphoribosyltransferase
MFHDRRDAGRRLASLLDDYATREPVVLGMPRGGVAVAAEVASHLEAPLDIIVVRKIGCPWQPELAIGALAEGGVRVVDDEIVRVTGVRPDELETVAAREEAELARRVSRYRGDRPPLRLLDRVVIIVDDGIATGSTARAAIGAVRAHDPSEVVLAAPVAAASTAADLRTLADAVVVADERRDLMAIGEAYADFRPTTDEEVVGLLQRATERVAAVGRRSGDGDGPGATPPEEGAG